MRSLALSLAVMMFSSAAVLLSARCSMSDGESGSSGQPGPRPSSNGEDRFIAERLRMVEEQIRSRGVRDPGVLAAMTKVPRHLFVPEALVSSAYEDGPLPIGHQQTISQPYIVALMTELLHPRAGHKILEVGTGSGYQAAVLAEIVGQVFTIEIVDDLARSATATLSSLGYKNIHVRSGDGYRGWPEEAPFDGVIVTAAPDHVPQPLVDQLKVGGRLVIPVGEGIQDLILLTKTRTGIVRENVTGVRFVPMTGEAEQGPKH